MKNCSAEEKLADYYKQIEKSLVGSSEEKKKVINHLQRDISDYIAEKPDYQFEDIVSQFGTAEAFAAEYLYGMDDQEITGRIAKTKKLKKWIILAAIAVVAVIAIGVAAIALENSRSVIYYREDGIVDNEIVTE